MGRGGYDIDKREARATSEGYYTKSFKQVSASFLKSKMDPKGIKLRESRDSVEHPNSFPIIIALDVTGSMEDIPKMLVRNGLPHIMDNIIQKGVKDPQILFLAVGDHECDRAPLQVGQFESSDVLLDKWLTSVWFEGRGGGNLGESYLLAHYFAARHTSTDHFDKRHKKGILITIGDEAFLEKTHKYNLQQIMGDWIQDGFGVEIVTEASKMYEIYHIHVKETYAGSLERNLMPWQQLLQERCIVVQKHEEIPDIISNLVIRHGLDTSTITEMKKEIKTDNSTNTEQVIL